MALIIKENSIESYSEEIRDALRNGKIAVYPTETCYGIGCIITSRAGVDGIFHLKKRSKSNPLPVIATDIEMINKYAVVTSAAEKLIKMFMPGPLTLLLDRKRSVPRWFPGEKIGIRIPGRETTRLLCELAGQPIISTSANIAGKRQFYEIAQAIKAFERKAAIIIDAGNLPFNQPSTVFDVEHNRVLRRGKITAEQIAKVLGE